MNALSTSAAKPASGPLRIHAALESPDRPSRQPIDLAGHVGNRPPASRLRVGHMVLLAVALACLVFGVWGGLVRLYWSLVPLANYNVHWVTFHGPLMVCGFLGTLIGLERATALGRWWGYAGPVLTGTGAVALVCGVLGATGPLLILLGSLAVVVVSFFLFLRQPSLELTLLAVGAGVWSLGNALWLYGWTIHQIIFWWMGFLLLTVFAERLELSRFLIVSRAARGAAVVAVLAFLAGLVVRPAWPLVGERVMGTAMIAIALWLWRYDVARRTVRRAGLPRFMALCLLIGYAWLGIVGLGLWMHEPLPPYGVLYDSILHAFFLGFVVSLVMAHAPIILPAVVGVEVPYSRWLYLPVVLLHGSLLGRIVGDILSVTATPSWAKIHGWGGTLNATALGLFFGMLLALALFGRVRGRLAT